MLGAKRSGERERYSSDAHEQMQMTQSVRRSGSGHQAAIIVRL